MTSSDIIALSSAITAACALFATFWQAWLSYKHNRLSVRPKLVWHVTRRDSPNSGIAFAVRNLGLGPAVIRERYFSKDNTRFVPPMAQTDEVKAFVAHAFGQQQVHYALKQFGLPGKDAAIPGQGEVVIADIEFPALPFAQLDTIVLLAGDVAFHVKYESLYGERFELEAR